MPRRKRPSSTTRTRVASIGLHAGGVPAYGLRRMLLDVQGRPKRVLEMGEYKAIQGEHTVLVPGPAEEVNTVRRIFRLYVRKRLSPLRIAKLLNEDGCPSPGVAWREETIRFMLRNERYVGTQIYNRKSCKLRSLPRRNERSLWITKEHAFEGIVPRDLFNAAQAVSRERQVVPPYSKQDLLNHMRRLLKKHGYLSQRIVDLDRGGPQVCAYRRHFGNLRKAFAEVGYIPPRQLRLTPATLRPKRVAAKTLARLRNALLERDLPVTVNPWTGVATMDGLSVAVAAARCILTPVHGLRSWQLRFRRLSHSDFVLLLRMDSENKKPLDFWLLPRSTVRRTLMVLREPQFASWRKHRFGTLDAVVRDIRTRVCPHRRR